MPRDAALALLRAHGRLALEPEEARLTADTIRFVEAHEDCLLRSCGPGHLTGSAWIVSPDRRRVLLTHHRKLDKWLQLGGHADGDPDLPAVARREAQEESGLVHVRPLGTAIFDLDVHWIPPRKADPGHNHYDLRFAFEAEPTEPLRISHESRDLAWVALDRVAELNPEESIARMVRKTRAALAR
jgi:8-oxo-dGTP pyrophosphatase MutT (NUDIX family)